MEAFRSDLWTNKTVFPAFEAMQPLQGVQYHKVYEFDPDGYRFLIGAAIIKHKGVLYASWSHSASTENDHTTRLAEKRSYDDGKTWQEYRVVTKNDDGYSRSHGVYLSLNGELYVFCPRATYHENLYDDLKMEAYRLTDAGEYECLGIALDDEFWPMATPILLNDGRLVMAGLKTKTGKEVYYGHPAVAVCDGKDLTKWEMKAIPFGETYKGWGETALFARGDLLTAVARNTLPAWPLVSYSTDGGQHWSEGVESNFPADSSKLYAGTLKNGLSYVVFNVAGRDYRKTLAIATGREQFDKVFIVRDDFDIPPKYNTYSGEWGYPYAYEDTENNRLLVAYHKHKEECEIASIPLEELE